MILGIISKKKQYLYHDTNSLFYVNYSFKNMLNIIGKLFNVLFLTIFPQAVHALSCDNLISIQLFLMRAGNVLIVYVLCLTTRSSSRFLHSLHKIVPFWRMPRIGDAMVIVFTLNARDRGLDPPSDTKDNKKSLKIPKRYSEPVYRRINNTMAKSTRRKQQTTIYNTLLYIDNSWLDKTKQNNTKTGVDLFASEGNSFCSTSDIYHATLVSDPVISHEWRKGGSVITTYGTYMRSFVTQILLSG